MAELTFTDAHMHFWDLQNPNLYYDWLQPGAPARPPLPDYSSIKCQKYLPDDFLGETRFANVGNIVHVQAALGIKDPVEETRWLQDLYARFGIPQGIVAYADLADPNVEETIRRHTELPNLRGVRDLRYDDYLTDAGWQRGYALLEKYGLIYCDDPLVEVMPHAAAIIERFPGITYCVDHAGWPRRRDKEYFREWRNCMRRLSAFPNTLVKISGLGMSEHRWTTDSLRPWVLECIDAWGTERTVFGSNWPVDRLFSSYGDVLNAYEEIISDVTPAERVALFSGNADRLFRLPATPETADRRPS
jgi:predicted TIM-barrel fold metal-dependent hydrolase